MMFQDLSSTPQIISTERPGRYVHVGDLIEEIQRLAAAAKGATGIDRQSAIGAASGLEALAAMLAITSATAK